jgi:probable F420-dependent oxidoreductase
VRFGLCLPNYGPATSPDAILRVARAAEDAGYDSVWVTDHILVPEKYSETFGQVIEALITLGYLAGVTQDIMLASSIIVLPQRDPILVAKQVAAIDRLSGGRTILGVGVGWMEDEYRFLRTDFHQRGRIADEWIQVMHTLWTEERSTFHGNWIHFDNTVFEPKPVQSEGPPIYIGGNSDAAIRRAATLGDGWHPGSIGPNELARGVAKLREWAGERSVTISLRGRVDLTAEGGTYQSTTGARYHRIGGPPSAAIDMVSAHTEAGLEHLVCYFDHQTAGELLAKLEQFAADVMPAFRA